jgi:lipopolysaccharide/colanic/teichoic acid biosynthesis glycosyltransferase/dTDP-4-dehydrorhamnose reductase
MNIHISGASGFVGRALCADLINRGHRVVPWVRKPSGLNSECVLPDLFNVRAVEEVLNGCDVFVHLAARVHQMGDDPGQSRAQYQLVNKELTISLASAALKAGAKHFIFMSSVKVVGETSPPGKPFNEEISCYPEDPYGQSKLDAERELLDFASQSGMVVTILRPPLIYGPGVKANFLSLMNWLSYSLPMPFRLIKNKRSFLYVGNLTSAIARCIEVLPRGSGLYFVSDGFDLSSHELGRVLCKSIGSAYLSLPIPAFFLKFLGMCLGKGPQISRLLGSLQINSSAFCTDFDWTPPTTLEDGFDDTANWFHKQRRIKRMNRIKRVTDLLLSTIALCLLFIPLIVVALMVKLTSRGPVLYWSDRVGIRNSIFRMPKFRSMKVGTPVVATHLLQSPDAHLTPIGGFLRLSSLDELPQLWCVFNGTMSWVGPRPALYNQDDLIFLRTRCGVDSLVPGVTGWAQINGRDELEIPVKVQYDREYLERRSLVFDIKILIQTFVKVVARKNVAH